MTARRIVRMAVALAFGVVPAFWGGSLAREQSAKDFVAAIYAQIVGPNEGFGLDTKADFDRAFEPVLASSMYRDADAAWRRRGAATFLANPFVDGPSWLVTDVKVAIADASPRQAIATVTFDDAGVPTAVRLDLVRLRTGWRIRDIHAKRGSLRALHQARCAVDLGFVCKPHQIGAISSSDARAPSAASRGTGR